MACDDVSQPQQARPASLILESSGQPLAGPAGKALDNPISVRILNERGRPVARTEVRWNVLAGSGDVEPDVSVSDESGVAWTNWILGPVLGEQQISATVAGLDPVVISATAVAGAPFRATIKGGNAQMGVVGDVLSQTVVIEIVDESGFPVANIPVRWSAGDGGSFLQSETITDSAGMASSQWRLGSASGMQRATATVLQLQQINLTASASPGPAVRLSSYPATLRFWPSDSIRLTISAFDAYNNRVEWEPDWTSSAPQVLSVVGPGLFRAGQAGAAIINTSINRITARIDVQVVPELNFVDISAGMYHTCAVADTGAAFCWGYNASGELGRQSTGASCIVPNPGQCELNPIRVPIDLPVATIAAGYDIYGYTCALTVSGAAYCWGKGGPWLGSVSSAPRAAPAPVNTPVRFRLLTAAAAHTCGVATNSMVYCWGANATGQLGNGTIGGESYSPEPVAGNFVFDTITALNKGATCGLTAESQVFCWGSNFARDLGTGRTESSLPAPTPLVLNQPFTRLGVGEGSGCAITSSKLAYCWGLNNVAGFSKLGNGSTQFVEIPEIGAHGLQWSNIVFGLGHTCGLDPSQVAYCWGAALLGNGWSSGSNEPQQVVGQRQFRKLVAGLGHTCGITLTGDVYCWGLNDAGQLGIGTKLNSLIPIRIAPPVER